MELVHHILLWPNTRFYFLIKQIYILFHSSVTDYPLIFSDLFTGSVNFHLISLKTCLFLQAKFAIKS